MSRCLLPLLALVLGILVFDLRAQELGATVQTNSSGAVTNVVFRVWAPNAVAVRVSGEFNNWATNASALIVDSATKIWSGTVTRARPGQAYKYVITTTNGQTLWRKDPRARQVRTLTGGAPTHVTNGSSSQASVVYDSAAFDWTGDLFVPPDPKDIVMYEMHVGTFYDPTPNDGQPATFDDAIQKLDYLKGLGVNMIALMPVQEFNGRHSWGYNPSDPFAIEETYGGPDAFKRFVKAAHLMDMAVQVDVVHNHYGDLSGNTNAWTSLKTSDLENFDGGEPYFYNQADEATRPGISKTKWGPRPRYSDTNVQSYILDNIKMYLDEYKVWALRWDSPRNITGYQTNPGAVVGDPNARITEASLMMSNIHTEIRNPARANSSRYYSIAEDAFNPIDPAPVLGGYHAHWEISYHDAFFSRLLATNAPLPPPFNLKYTNGPATMDTIKFRVENKEEPGFRVTFLENHDKCGDHNSATDGKRLAHDFDTNNPASLNAQRKTMMAAAATLASAGTPMLWMGQEQLADGDFNDKRALDWNRAAQFPGIVRFHRDMIHLRNTLPALKAAGTNANQTPFASVVTNNQTNGLLAFRRHDGTSTNNDVLVAMNFSDTTNALPTNARSGGFTNAILNSHTTNYAAGLTNIGPMPGSVVAASSNVTMGPWSVLIFARTNVSLPSIDTNGNGIDDGIDLLTGSRAALPGSFNNWDTSSLVMKWDDASKTYRYVARFAAPGVQSFRVLTTNWFPPTNQPAFSFTNTNVATWEIRFAPSNGLAQISNLGTNDAPDAWKSFHFGTNAFSPSADSDGDNWSNLEEFRRGSDPTHHEESRFAVVGHLNGWTWSDAAVVTNAFQMRYVGHGLWKFFRWFPVGTTDFSFKISQGPTENDPNWGASTNATNGFAEFKGSNNFRWLTNLKTWQVLTFNERSGVYSVENFKTDSPDTDGDSVPDSWEVAFGLDPFADDRDLDADDDQVWNKFEYARGTSPRDPTDHYKEVSLPGDWLPFAPRSAWLNNSDPRLRMLWRPEINRWELLRYVPRQVNLEVRAANHPFGSGDWAGTLGNQVLSFPARGYYLVRFEESSKMFDPPVSMSTNDADLDGLPEYWEIHFGQANPTSDVDLDGATALAEFMRGSDPNTPDKSPNMHVVGHVSSWSFTNAPMRWSDAKGIWELLVFTTRLQESPQRAKFVHVTNPLSRWDNPNWGDGFTNPPVVAADGWADRDGADIAYNVPSLPSYALFEFEEVWGRYRAGVIDSGASGDTNRDGLPDDWASYHAVNDAEADPDGDGRPNIKEFRLNMNPVVADGAALATRHPAMSVAGSFVNDWNEAGVRMTLVDDFLWRVDRQITNPNAQAFKFNVGNWGTQWGEAVKNGSTGRAHGSEDIALPNLGPATYRFIFNEATLQYFVARLDTYAGRYPGIPPEQRRPRTGLAALNEYLFGGTLLVPPPSANLPVHGMANGRPRLEFIARIDDARLSHIVETSTDLSGGWSTNGVTLMSTETSDFKSGLMRHIYEAKGDGHSRRFFRIRTLLQP